MGAGDPEVRAGGAHAPPFEGTRERVRTTTLGVGISEHTVQAESCVGRIRQGLRSWVQ